MMPELPFHMGDAKDHLSGTSRRRVLQGLERGFLRSSQHMACDLHDIGVLISMPKAFSGTSDWGVGGHSWGAHKIEIYVDPANPNFVHPDLEERLSAIYAEESHHSIRWRNPGFGNTLGETLVTEGLAKNFVLETGHAPCFTTKGFSDEKLAELVERAKLALNEPYDREITLHKAWYWGTDPKIPLFAGYALGAAIVGNYLQTVGMTAAECVSISHQTVLKPWLDGVKPTTSYIDLHRPAVRSRVASPSAKTFP